MAALAELKPAFVPDGRITAGNSSQIVDGAAALLVMSARKARELGVRARAALSNRPVMSPVWSSSRASG